MVLLLVVTICRNEKIALGKVTADWVFCYNKLLMMVLLMVPSLFLMMVLLCVVVCVVAGGGSGAIVDVVLGVHVVLRGVVLVTVKQKQ